MATFPAGKLLYNGFKHEISYSIVRSDGVNGPAKQALLATQEHLIVPVKYYFTKDEFKLFQEWFRDTINVIGAFDWTEPLSDTVIKARIVNGDISDAIPINQVLSHWTVGFKIERVG